MFVLFSFHLSYTFVLSNFHLGYYFALSSFHMGMTFVLSNFHWVSNTVSHSYIIMSKLTINNVTMTLSHCSKIIYFNRNLHEQNNSNAIKTKNRSVHLTYMCIFLGSFIKTLYYLELYLIDQYHFMNIIDSY